MPDQIGNITVPEIIPSDTFPMRKASNAQATPMTFAVVYAGLDADAAYGWMETACQLRDDMRLAGACRTAIEPEEAFTGGGCKLR